MSLRPGTALGHYEILALLGAGGMGEVYRARDTRLGREVALKILPEAFVNDPERLARFRREAKMLASLNHPHIAQVHGFEEIGTTWALVLELVEGEDLAQRLTRGAMPTDEALPIARQIAEAIEVAHETGMVHRDLKPANITVRHDGHVKVLDFGLAKAMEPPGSPVADPALSPTLTGPATLQGALLGTAAYMAPEQARGKSVDKRADIWAFGVVLYEMLTGRRAFPGANGTEVLAAVMRDTPDLTALPADTPSSVRHLIARCLERDPSRRLRDIGEARIALEERAGGETFVPGGTTRERSFPIGATSRHPWWVAAAAIGACGVALVAYAVVGKRPLDPRRDEPRQATRLTASAGVESPSADLRFELWPERGTSYASSFDVPFALAPDGRSLAYVAVGHDGIKRLWIRRLDATGEPATEIAGTDNANTPFWSPDSAWIGFFNRHDLLKVRPTDRRVHTITMQASAMAGATWNADGVIVFAGGTGGLSRVSAEGGPVAPVTAGEGSHFWPQFIGDGRHFVYAALIPREIRLGSLTGEPSRVLMNFPVGPSSLVYARGYLFFGSGSRLFARAFDEATLEFVGEPIDLRVDLPSTQLGRMPFAVSADGPLAVWPYLAGTPATLQWLTETGVRASVVETPARYLGLALAPDASRLAVSRRNSNGGANVWIRDLARSAETQLTFDGGGLAPRWSTDGGRLVTTTTKVPPRLLIRSLKAPTPDVERGGSQLPAFASSWCGDGARIVSVRIDPTTRDDLYIDHLQDGRTERLPMNSAANEYQAVVSPDDRWLAYVTDESGRDEVWVASFPSGQLKRQVSVDGGASPQWTDGGRELAYISARRWLTVRSFAGTDTDIALGKPRELFDAATFVETSPLITPTANAYVAAVNGRRFLAAVRANDSAVPAIQLIVNWRTLLRDR